MNDAAAAKCRLNSLHMLLQCFLLHVQLGNIRVRVNPLMSKKTDLLTGVLINLLSKTCFKIKRKLLLMNEVT